MDVLKAEIARKRKQLEKAAVVAPTKKFFRQGDLAAAQQEDYWNKYYAKHKDAPRRSQDEPEEEAVARLDATSSEGESSATPAEVRSGLRERGQPCRLFGESDDEARRRLRRLQLDAPELKEGWKNEFQSAMNKVDEDFMKEVIAGSVGAAGRHDVAVEEVADMEAIKGRIAADLGKGEDAKRDCRIVFDFYNYLLQRWGRELNKRDEATKRSAQGKIESAVHSQSAENLKPLFSQLQSGSVASDIREHLVQITRILAEGDYIRANNAYMEMAIGNAPWPVGVTRSGLHQRPGSAKMYVKNIAHVLNDETQRKYIQGLKRLMTKCQKYFPADPSRCIDYVPNHTSS